MSKDDFWFSSRFFIYFDIDSCISSRFFNIFWYFCSWVVYYKRGLGFSIFYTSATHTLRKKFSVYLLSLTVVLKLEFMEAFLSLNILTCLLSSSMKILRNLLTFILFFMEETILSMTLISIFNTPSNLSW